MIHSIGKVSFAGIIAALLGAVSVRAQSSEAGFVLSERVGPVIDAEERAYFGLFPGIDGFVAARPQPPTALTFRIVVERAGQPDTTLHVDPEVAEVLGQYLDEFEYIYRDTRATDWNYLYQVARVRPPFEPGEPLTVTRTDGTVIKGQLVHIDEEGLLVTVAQKVPAMLRDPEAAVWIAAGTVREIRDQRSGVRRLFKTMWLLEAGSQAMYEPHVVPFLKRGEMLPAVLSPELRTVRARGGVVAPYPMAEPVEQIYQAQMASRLHVTLMIQPFPPVIHVPDVDTPVSTASGGSETTIRYQNPMQYVGASYVVRMGYDLTAHVRVGGEYGWKELFSRKPTTAVGQWNSESSRMVGSFLTGWVVVGLKRAHPEELAYVVAPNRWDMLAVRAGTGVSIGWFDGQHPAWMERAELLADEQVRVGGAAALDVEYYFTHRLSVVTGVRGSFFPGLQIPFVELTYEQDDPDDYTWQQKEYRKTLWMMDFRAGLRVHLRP